MTDNNEIPADGGIPVTEKDDRYISYEDSDGQQVTAPVVELLAESDTPTYKMSDEDLVAWWIETNGGENRGEVRNVKVMHKPENAPAKPDKPAEKPKQVKSVEIVSIFGTDKISGVSSFEDLPDRVNVSGHIEEMVEYEREGKLVKDIKNIPACVSVPRSAIISMNKTYHQG
jgi:hypothetical protein